MRQGANRQVVRAGPLLLLALLLVPGPALARSKHKRARAVKVTAPAPPPAEADIDFVSAPIVPTGVARFDEVFAAGSPLVAAVEARRLALDTGRSALKQALGVADAELTSKAMAALATAAGGTLHLDEAGATPVLKVSGAIPEAARAGVDTLNTLLAAAAAANNGALTAEARRITSLAATFPDEAAALVATDPRAAALALAAVNNNTRTLTALPEQAEALNRLSARLLSDARTAFPTPK